jgi:hypothetical protein
MNYSSLSRLALIVLLLHTFVAGAQYHLQPTIQINIDDISEIAFINDTSLAVKSSLAVHLLSGPSYQTTTQKYEIDSEAKMNKREVGTLSKDSSSIIFKHFSQQNYTFINPDMMSDIIVTENYALLGQ